MLPAAVLLASGVGTASADRGLHLPETRGVDWSWNVTDGAGFHWDIASYGMVSDGTNDAYDGGMRLDVNGSSFYWTGPGWLSEDGREVEIGPKMRGGVRVWRRIYVDAHLGYCRWVDIFQNPGKREVKLSAEWNTNLGTPVEQIWTPTDGDKPGADDWALVTADKPAGRHPAVAHVLAGRSARSAVTASAERGSDEVRYALSRTLAAGETIAVCIFQAQRRDLDAARDFIEGFGMYRELARVPAALRRVVVNMAGASVALGRFELPRHPRRDLVILRNQDEVLGRIVNEGFTVKTFYADLELPAERVVGLATPEPHDPEVHVLLTDGQVVGGRWTNGPLLLELPRGDRMVLPAERLTSAAFRVSEQKPAEFPLESPLAVLRSGQRLTFELDGLPAFETVFGPVPLQPEALASIELETPDGGLHRLLFTNGSTLSGLLADESLQLDLDLAGPHKIGRHLLQRLLLPHARHSAPELTELRLRNEDVLLGRLVTDRLTLETGSGKVSATPEEIASVDFLSGAPGRVRLEQRDRTTLTGRLTQDHLRFRIEPGPELDVYVGHIDSIDVPEPGE